MIHIRFQSKVSSITHMHYFILRNDSFSTPLALVKFRLKLSGKCVLVFTIFSLPVLPSIIETYTFILCVMLVMNIELIFIICKKTFLAVVIGVCIAPDANKKISSIIIANIVYLRCASVMLFS